MEIPSQYIHLHEYNTVVNYTLSLKASVHSDFLNLYSHFIDHEKIIWSYLTSKEQGFFWTQKKVEVYSDSNTQLS